jgi:glycosyltransferase involved in cell wall biosynthesis
MRVGIIAPPWVRVPPRAYGGTESVLDGLARGLQRAGHQVVLFASGDSTCPVPRAWHFETAVGTGRPDGGLLELRHVIAAYEQLRDVDVVHDHTLAGPVYAMGFSNGPVVTTNHGPFGEGLEEFYRTVSTKVPVVAISYAQASMATGVRLAGVIHHGVDIEEFPEGDGSGSFALFLGRLSAAKGVHTAAQVALAAGMPLVIAGKCSEPAEVAYFKDQVKPLLGRSVEFVGELDRKAKLELLAKASLLLNPIAWDEPFGMVMLEALACGTPVVATHRGAAPELVDDGVTGVLADDHLGLVEAVGRAAGLDRTRCRKVAAERFSLDEMVARHLVVYDAARQ